MRGIRFINDICKTFNLEIIDIYDGPIHSLLNRKSRKVTHYILSGGHWIEFRSKIIKIGILAKRTITFPISEKYKVLQKINEHLCEELDS